MKSLLGVVLLLSSSTHAYPQTNGCEDSTTKDCRARFVRTNLPTIHEPNLNNKSESGLYNQIQQDIDEAKNLEKPLLTAKAARDAADGFVFDPTSIDSWGKLLGGEKRRDIDAYNAANHRLIELQTEKYEKFNAAIARTIQLYRLTPRVTQPVDHPNAVISEPVKPWAPHYSEAEMTEKSSGLRRRYNDDELRAMWLKRGVEIPAGQPVPPIKLGGSDPDQASIAIFYGSFVSPEKLAASIFHETVHWLDQNSLGRPFNGYEHDESEALAYELMIEQQGPLHLSAEADGLRRMRDGYIIKAKNDTVSPGQRDTHDTWLPSDSIDIPEDAKLVSPPGDGKRADSLDRVVANAIRQVRKKSQEMHSASIRRDQTAVAAREAYSIANAACQDGGVVEQSDLDALPANLDSDAYLGAATDDDSTCVSQALAIISNALSAGQRLTPSRLNDELFPGKRFPASAGLPERAPIANAILPKPVRMVTLGSSELGDLAEKACKNPAALTDADLNHYRLLTPHDADGIEKFTPELTACGQAVYDQLVVALRASRQLTPFEVANMARQALGIPIPQPAYVPRPRRDPDRDPDPGEDCFIATDGVRMCRH